MSLRRLFLDKEKQKHGRDDKDKDKDKHRASDAKTNIWWRGRMRKGVSLFSFETGGCVERCLGWRVLWHITSVEVDVDLGELLDLQ